MPTHKKQIVKPASEAELEKVESELAEVTSKLDKVASRLTEVKPEPVSPKEEEIATPNAVLPASEVKTSVEPVIDVIPQDAPAPTADPLTDFKEKMVEEESILDEAPKKNYMWPILLIFVITILLLVGVFLYKYGISIKDKVNVVTLVPTPTAAPEPTKAIDLTKYEIEIQNGGGVSGEAGRQEASLGGEGFTISSIGNADNSDYADTLIKAKAEVEKAFLDKLKSVLENTFTLGEIETLSESSSVPVVVIIGTKK